MEVFNNEWFSSLSGRLDAMEATIQSISAQYLKQVDYEDREKKLATLNAKIEKSTNDFHDLQKEFQEKYWNHKNLIAQIRCW